MDDGIGIVDEGGTGPLRLWGHNLSKHPKTTDSKKFKRRLLAEEPIMEGCTHKTSLFAAKWQRFSWARLAQPSVGVSHTITYINATRDGGHSPGSPPPRLPCNSHSPVRVAASTSPLRSHATERAVRWSCPFPRSFINAFGKRKQRTFLVLFGTDRSVETKQEVSKKMFHYPLQQRRPSFVCQRSPIVFARHQGRIQSRRSKIEAEYTYGRPQVTLVEEGKVHADPHGTCPMILKPDRTVDPGLLFLDPVVSCLFVVVATSAVLRSVLSKDATHPILARVTLRPLTSLSIPS